MIDLKQYNQAEEKDFFPPLIGSSNQSENRQLSVRDQIAVIKKWLHHCVEAHKAKCWHNTNDLPSRLIDVNDVPTNIIGSTGDVSVSDESYEVKIVKSSELSKSKPKYLALSHCWGDHQSEKAHYQLCDGKRRFLFDKLPRTFQHAVILTKEIGERYLWIDSLCINQDNKEDWEKESEKMYEVFKNARFTIAATSARHSDEGFLNGPVTIPDLNSWSDNFERDFQSAVEDGVLNKRAWVLQERILSQRILHFTENQLYMECGGGVCRAPFGYMKNGKYSFRNDPLFPKLLLKSCGLTAKMKHFQSLFRDYSSYGLTEVTDRPIAIKSLVNALAKVFDPETEDTEVGRGGSVHHGVFGAMPYLHRSLLWYRCWPTDLLSPSFSLFRLWLGEQEDLIACCFRLYRFWTGESGLEPSSGLIDFGQSQTSQSQQPPTWSWMSYDGLIDYMKLKSAPEWDTSVRFSGDPVRLKVRVAKYRADVSFEGKGDNEWIAYGEAAKKVGSGWFDRPTSETPEGLRCALIGRDEDAREEGRKYYILLLPAKGASPLERLGVGWIYERAINFPAMEDLEIP